MEPLMKSIHPEKEKFRERYSRFINGLRLEDMFIEEGSFKRLILSIEDIPETAHLEVAVKPTNTEFPVLKDKQFEVRQTLSCSLKFVNKKRKIPLTKIKVSYYLRYSSEVEVEEKFFDIFQKRNIPVQIWPYLREFIGNCMYRMGLPPLVLPVMKIVNL